MATDSLALALAATLAAMVQTASTLRVVEIAEILGVSHQRASKIVGERGFVGTFADQYLTLWLPVEIRSDGVAIRYRATGRTGSVRCGFPKPVGREGQSCLGDRREVTAWAKVWRREKPLR
jgi:hypothetical protein